MLSLRLALINKYLKEIDQMIGGVKDAVPCEIMYSHHASGDFAQIVSKVCTQMGLHGIPMKVRVHQTPPGVAAYVERHMDVNSNISKVISKSKGATITLSSKMVNTAPADTTIFAIAHELSHVLLDVHQSQIAEFEMAVDLTAMMSGYAEYYLDGREYLVQLRRLSTSSNLPEDIFGKRIKSAGSSLKSNVPTRKHTVGYLTELEIVYVLSQIKTMRSR